MAPGGTTPNLAPNLAWTLAHNIAEHLEVVEQLMSGQSGVSDPAKARLMAHIAEEERSNAARLNALMADQPEAPPRELRLVRDHSEMLLDILEGAIPAPLGQRLLHHMLEEHGSLLDMGRGEGPPLETGSMGPTLRLSLGSLRGE